MALATVGAALSRSGETAIAKRQMHAEAVGRHRASPLQNMLNTTESKG
jgi:hypothetical protein